MDDAQMQDAVNEIAWKLIDAKCSKRILEMILREARERGRFGLRDVLVAFALVHSYPSHPWQGFSSSIFAQELADVFDPLDVDLWCMELTEDATPVAGQDVYSVRDTCAMIVYGRGVYMCAMQGRTPVAVTYDRARCRVGLQTMLRLRNASELLVRTVPVALCTGDCSRARGYGALFDPFLQTCTLGPDSMRKLVACCIRARIDVAVVLRTESAHCLADDPHMAAMALVGYRVCTDGFREWYQRAHDTIRNNPAVLYEELLRSVTSTNYHQRWLFFNEKHESCTPILCSMLDEEHRIKMRGDLKCVVAKVEPGTMKPTQLECFTAQVSAAIAACGGDDVPKSAVAD